MDLACKTAMVGGFPEVSVVLQIVQHSFFSGIVVIISFGLCIEPTTAGFIGEFDLSPFLYRKRVKLPEI